MPYSQRPVGGACTTTSTSTPAPATFGLAQGADHSRGANGHLIVRRLRRDFPPDRSQEGHRCAAERSSTHGEWNGHFDPRVFRAFVKAGELPVGALVGRRAPRVVLRCPGTTRPAADATGPRYSSHGPLEVESAAGGQTWVRAGLNRRIVVEPWKRNSQSRRCGQTIRSAGSISTRTESRERLPPTSRAPRSRGAHNAALSRRHQSCPCSRVAFGAPSSILLSDHDHRQVSRTITHGRRSGDVVQIPSCTVIGHGA